MDFEALGIGLRGGKLWGLAGAISRLGKRHQWDEALHLLETVDQACWPIRPDAAAFNAGMKVMAVLRRWRQVVQTFERMQDMLTRPTVVTLGSVMNSLVQGSRRSLFGKTWLRATALLAESKIAMRGDGVVLLNTLLAASGIEDCWQVSMQTLQEAAWLLVETDVISWNSAVAASQKRWTNGLLCIASLRACSLVCDAISFNSAARCCAGALQWQRVLLFMGTPGMLSTPGINAGMTSLSRRSLWQQVGGTWKNQREVARAYRGQG